MLWVFDDLGSKVSSTLQTGFLGMTDIANELPNKISFTTAPIRKRSQRVDPYITAMIPGNIPTKYLVHSSASNK
eukprot:3455238-Amphidinium_carterae.1